MKMLSLILIVFLGSCTSANKKRSNESELIQMNNVWQAKSTKENIIKSFGQNFKEVEEGISYNYGATSFTKMAFFFNESNKLVDQFAIIDDEALNNFKNELHCDWDVRKSQLDKVHAVKTIESGECLDQHVKYFFRKDLGFYEVRWVQ